MTTNEPVVVYRGRSLSAANDLTSYLRENGVDAKLVAGDPLRHAHPAIDFFHDVMAVNFDRDALRVLIANWESLPRTETPAIDRPFCYHCGSELDEPAIRCPHCNESLDD